MYKHHHNHFWGLFSVPQHEWEEIRNERSNILHFALLRLGVFAAIPAMSFFFGISQVGWSLSGSEYSQVGIVEASYMSVAFYFAIIISSIFMGYCTYLMEKSFATEASFERCLLFVTYTATPMYVAGIVGIAPVVWLCMIVLMIAVSYSVYLLYLGIPIFMDIPEGKAFIVSTSVISAGLCTLVGFIVITVIIWSSSF